MLESQYRTDKFSGTTFRTFNPSHPSEVVAEYSASTPALVIKAAEQGLSAFQSWRAIPQIQRAELVHSWITQIVERQEEISRNIVLEQGKPISEARGETSKAISEAKAMVALAIQSGTTEMASSRGNVRNIIVRRPRGVVAAMTPWNFPILTPLRKIVPALLAGNTVVIKPSEFTPAACILAVQAAHEILPANVLQYVLGARKVGETLVSAHDITAVSFTGSVPTGRMIGAVAGQKLMDQNLELGGKNAAIITNSADIDYAVTQSSLAAFLCSGQRCTAVSRIIIHDTVFDEFIGKLKEKTADIKLDDGIKEDTEMGPLINEEHRGRIEKAVKQAKEEGARIILGGTSERPSGCEDGFFFAPTLIEADPSMSCAHEEIFGPVVTLMRYKSYTDAINLLNATQYGLAASLFSNNLDEVETFIADAEAGMLFVNQGTAPDNHMPFVGTKSSGIGPGSVGPSALKFATVEHSVYLRSRQ